MTTTTNFPFTTATNYTYDNTKIEVTGGVAKLKLQSANTDFTEDFADDTGFTYDAAKAEFTGGLVRQKITAIIEAFSQLFANDTGFTYDSAKAEFASGLARQKTQRPTGATFGATYTSSIDGSWGNGTLTGTATGGAAVSGGKLDLTSNDIRYVTYGATSNGDSRQVGCVRFKITPNYSGSPVDERCFFEIAKSNSSSANSIQLRHSGSYLTLIARDESTNIITNTLLGTFSPVSGTEYEIELNWDFTTGATRLFVNGTQSGSTLTETGTRSTEIGYIYVGSSRSGLYKSNFKIDNFEYFTTVQHTANYTSGYSLAEKDYLETVVTCPAVAYAYNIASFGAPTITSVNAPKYVINGYAYFGGSWQASSNTYATAMTAADWVTNVATFPGGQLGTSAIVKVIFQDSNTLGSIDSIAFDINENHYVTSNVTLPEMAHVGDGTILAFNTFAVTESNAPRYTLQIGRSGNYLYWNGSAWVTSDGSFAQANTAADFSTNCTSLPVSGQEYGQFKLHFNAGNTQMSCANLTVNMLVNNGYLTSNPSILINDYLTSSELVSITETSTKAGSDEIKYTIEVAGQAKWSNVGTIENSDNTYAKSNTDDEVNAVIGDWLSTRRLIRFRAFIHSEDGTTTPQLDLLSVLYNMSIDLTAPSLVEVEGFFYDINGPIASKKVYCRPYAHGFWNDSVFHPYYWDLLGTTDENGYLAANIYKQPSGEYWELKVDGDSKRYKIELSSAAEQNLNALPTWEVLPDEG